MVEQPNGRQAKVTFRWLGVGGIEIKSGREALAIDPFFTRPSFGRLWFGRVHPNRRLVAKMLPVCDHVLVTHAHWDHLMDVEQVVRASGAIAYGSPNTCSLLQAVGIAEHRTCVVAAGDKLDVGDFRVEVLSAVHGPILGLDVFSGPLSPGLAPPLRIRDYRMDEHFGYLIHVDGLRILDWCGEGLECIPRAEVLFVGAEKGVSFYRALVRAVKPQIVIPIHWDDFFRPLSKSIRPMLAPPMMRFPFIRRMNPADLKREIEDCGNGIRAFVPEIFRSYALAEMCGVSGR